MATIVSTDAGAQLSLPFDGVARARRSIPAVGVEFYRAVLTATEQRFRAKVRRITANSIAHVFSLHPELRSAVLFTGRNPIRIRPAILAVETSDRSATVEVLLPLPLYGEQAACLAVCKALSQELSLSPEIRVGENGLEGTVLVPKGARRFLIGEPEDPHPRSTFVLVSEVVPLGAAAHARGLSFTAASSR